MATLIDQVRIDKWLWAFARTGRAGAPFTGMRPKRKQVGGPLGCY